ncbi:hypothetical protein MNEG_10205 [Monoraphidium neglectum]|uniref:Uncharacterized protein n=1 Tax=Monoraphidium neglectum TaxID=145388 RepID=A0A0D2M283_9CHLO|nr:hypothetical protein MNEG_10205 [Monoraphidium neglectum]KIY97754.1 hypothetical protein MNEG_10205 [Monoraphidium neglectum]|eukprot:XP_013896774.1 hypothetical protein MNEG_10205 [Monoraphidium neglectum]
MEAPVNEWQQLHRQLQASDLVALLEGDDFLATPPEGPEGVTVLSDAVARRRRQAAAAEAAAAGAFGGEDEDDSLVEGGGGDGWLPEP